MQSEHLTLDEFVSEAKEHLANVTDDLLALEKLEGEAFRYRVDRLINDDQVVAMLSLEFSDVLLAPQIEEAVIDLERKVREENPEVVALFVKPQTAKTFQDQHERLLSEASFEQDPSIPN